jgi:uncharacterized protein YndB with AHSA1/START domain
VRIDARPDAVWAALTDPDLMTEWFAESAEVALDDGRFEFWGRYTPLGDRARQQLRDAEPDRSLRFDWDLDGDEPSTVEMSLEPHPEGGTVVTVIHAGVPAAQRLALDCFWPVTLANLAAQSEGLQTMPPFDFSAPAQEAALARTVIDVPVEEVYAYLLDPAKVGAWINGKATIEPHVGGAYDFGWQHGPEQGPVQVVELNPDKLLAYSWRSAGSPDTVVRWQLRGVRGSTFLTLVHEGFTDDALAEEYRQG